MVQYYVVSDELYHHGILGMKWGVRRYQNADGSLTAAGQKRYNKRQAIAKSARGAAKSSASRSKSAENSLKDVEKNRYNSKAFREGFSEISDSDFKRMGYSSKKEALDLLKTDLYKEQQYYKDEATKLRKVASHLENTPITERTLVDDIDRGKKIARVTGGIMFASVSALTLPAYTSGVISGKEFAKIILGSGVGSSIITSEMMSRSAEKAYKKHGIDD